MKASLLAVVVMGASVLPLTACASANNSEAAADQNTRSIYVGANATQDRVVQVPVSQGATTEQPYALRGEEATNSAKHSSIQTDLWTGRPLQGTNGF